MVLLQFHANTREYVLKLYELDRPGKLEQAIELMDQWIRKQDHLVKKDFDKRYIETELLNAKGSIEKAKTKLEKTCVMRTLLPNFFSFTNIKEDFNNALTTQCTASVSAKLTPDHFRTIIFKFYDNAGFQALSYMELYKYFNGVIYEYLKIHDYCAGYIVVMDFSEVPIKNVIAKLNPMEFKKQTTILLESHGMKIKRIIFVSASKTVNSLVKIIKPLMSEKIANRIMVCKNLDELHTIVPKTILPEELGGTERSYKSIQEDWLNTLSEHNNLKQLMEMQEARVCENYIKADKFEEFSELTGSFLTLDID